MAQFALRWILMFPEVSTVIAGSKNPQQAADNTQAAELPPLSKETMRRVQEIYDKSIRAQVEARW
jgi:aryl-alcohol dehydrogenase-like predicted oxidoreductase